MTAFEELSTVAQTQQMNTTNTVVTSPRQQSPEHKQLLESYVNALSGMRHRLNSILPSSPLSLNDTNSGSLTGTSLQNTFTRIGSTTALLATTSGAAQVVDFNATLSVYSDML